MIWKDMRHRIRFLLICAILALMMNDNALAKEKKITVGLVEDAILMPWGIKLPARIDTGAAMSSLDAREMVVKGDRVEFKLPAQYGGQSFDLPVAGWRHVRSSESRERRPFVVMEFCLGGRLIKTRVNLNDRSKVKYPFLIGRNALKSNFVVDCMRERCAPSICPEGQGK